MAGSESGRTDRASSNRTSFPRENPWAEDIWYRMPQNVRALKWKLSISRDSVNDEPGEVMEESFDHLAPDIRVALDLKKNGGFTMKFEPNG